MAGGYRPDACVEFDAEPRLFVPILTRKIADPAMRLSGLNQWTILAGGFADQIRPKFETT